jgi:Cdc6-like AAA superfamily ATPase
MKYYESHYDEYINSVEKYNIHPELIDAINHFPSKNSDLNNCIFYGPTGSGKYSQVLKIIKKYSPSELKYDKKITLQNDKQNYIYKISDVHYEIDISLLGCNSKIIWHEVFLQIIDIISVKQDKFGIIVCKNFHLIHTVMEYQLGY